MLLGEINAVLVAIWPIKSQKRNMANQFPPTGVIYLGQALHMPNLISDRNSSLNSRTKDHTSSLRG